MVGFLVSNNEAYTHISDILTLSSAGLYFTLQVAIAMKLSVSLERKS
jgi:hypothetical protein